MTHENACVHTGQWLCFGWRQGIGIFFLFLSPWWSWCYTHTHTPRVRAYTYTHAVRVHTCSSCTHMYLALNVCTIYATIKCLPNHRPQLNENWQWNWQLPKDMIMQTYFMNEQPLSWIGPHSILAITPYTQCRMHTHTHTHTHTHKCTHTHTLFSPSVSLIIHTHMYTLHDC